MYFIPNGCLDSGSWSICNGTEYWHPQPPSLVIGDASTSALEWLSWVGSSAQTIAAVWAGEEVQVATVACALFALTLLTLLYLWFSHGGVLQGGGEQEEEVEEEIESGNGKASSCDSTIEDEGSRKHSADSE